MPKSSFFYTFFILLFLTGCIGKYQIEKSVTCKVVIKNEKFAIADMGFLKESGNYKNLQILTAGKVVLNIELSRSFACINGRCTTREDFNRRFFKKEHYKKIMDDILNGYPIYKGMNMKKSFDGFIQKITGRDFSITYIIKGKSIYFRDVMNKILIKIERI